MKAHPDYSPPLLAVLCALVLLLCGAAGLVVGPVLMVAR